MFPKQPDLKEQLAGPLRAITQLAAQRLLDELNLRDNAGQHQFVDNLLKRFPSEGVGGEILQGVRELRQTHETRLSRRDEVVRQLRALTDRLKNTIAKENLRPILDEIDAELNFNTLDRMAAFLQNAADPQTPDAEKLALAVSGWLLGADGATVKLPTAISAYKVRDYILEYLGQRQASQRERTATYIRQESGGELAVVAGLLAHMKPPAAPAAGAGAMPGYYEVQVPMPAKEPPATYCVQLPPEYDPWRRYPAIVALHAEGESAPRQIDWWAGQWSPQTQRTGQAARHGYIVIAPEWAAHGQTEYGSSFREHAIVLASLRDACRRFAIDTDRVYLAGHSMGGDAAWDIGLAHPDLWAGVIPIAAMAQRYCNYYKKNARYVPFYVVAGELDGARLPNSSIVLNHCLSSSNCNTTLIEFRGRGHEDFYEEILAIFDWMGRCRRHFFPRQFACATMRPWDNFFWWVEVEDLAPRTTVDPADWPPPKNTQPSQVSATSIPESNAVTVRSGAARTILWLSPEMFNFKRRAAISINGHAFGGSNPMVRPDLRTLLEDVRTRGDRQHPFWARVDTAPSRKE
jgi:predicted esterase